MHPEIKQLVINILVLTGAVLVPILIMLGAFRGIQALASTGEKPLPNGGSPRDTDERE